jgi:hypothetical protein
MATDPDLITELAIRHAWDVVSTGGNAAWRRTQDYNFYDEEAVDQVFSFLTRTGGLSIRSAEVPMTETYNTSVIAVGLQGESPYKQFLGQDAHLRPAKLGPSGETMTGLVRQYMTEGLVGVYIIAPTKDIVRMLSRFVRTAMASLSAWFMKQGMESPPAMSIMSDLEPLMLQGARESETLVKFVRRLSFSFKLVDRLTPLDITPPVQKFGLIHAEGDPLPINELVLLRVQVHLVVGSASELALDELRRSKTLRCER